MSEEQTRLIDDRLATKDDLSRLETGLRSGMEKLGAGLRHEMRELEIGLCGDMEKLGADLRHEIQGVETGLRHEIGDLRKEIDAKFADVDSEFASVYARLAEMKFDLVKWIIALRLAQTGLVISVLKFFPGY